MTAIRYPLDANAARSSTARSGRVLVEAVLRVWRAVELETAGATREPARALPDGLGMTDAVHVVLAP